MGTKEVKRLFYKLYPDSDPNYFPYFKFVKHMDGGKLTSIDVYYRTDWLVQCVSLKGRTTMIQDGGGSCMVMNPQLRIRKPPKKYP